MTILSTLSRIASAYRRAQRRYVTERQIEAMPYELQKDIGWPSARPARPYEGIERHLLGR